MGPRSSTSLLFVLLVSAPSLALGLEEKVSPSEKFAAVVNERNETFAKFREKVIAEEMCQGPDYSCVLKELKATGLQSSADLDNGISLLSWVAQKRFQRGDCAEVCRMNIYAEYSASVVDLLSSFSRKNILVNMFPKEHPETKFLVINEELRLYKEFAKLNEKLLQHHKKIVASMIFRPDLSKRMDSFKSEIEAVKPSELLKGSYLSSLNEKDQVIALVTEDGMKSERERMEKRDLVSQFRADVH